MKEKYYQSPSLHKIFFNVLISFITIVLNCDDSPWEGSKQKVKDTNAKKHTIMYSLITLYCQIKQL